MKKHTSVFSLILFFSIVLCGCKKEDNNSTISSSREVIKLGVLYDNQEVTRQVNKFNKNNSDYLIEIKNYGELESGLDQIKYEIISGEGPDLIDFGGGYSESVMVRGLTVDLYEMMEADKDFHKEDYYENIIDSMAIDGRLYAISPHYSIISFAGKSGVIEQESWTMREMYQYFAQLPAGSIFFPGDTKDVVFGYLCIGSINDFIDWDTGTCYFTSDDFKEMLLFSNSFRSFFQLEEEKSIIEMYQEGEALLYPVAINNVWEVTADKIILDNQNNTYVGYPVTDSDKEKGITGNVVKADEIILGINKNSDKKGAAWSFIRSFLEKDYQVSIKNALPLRIQAMEEKIQTALAGVSAEKAEYSILFEGEDAIPITRITEADAMQLRDIIESTTRSSSIDYELYNIIQEEAAFYFSGDKTLEDTVEIIQSRVQLYVKEKY